MRPLKLEISAFCSYPNKTVIDLEKLGDSGIYLITGNTGAGKTTIFDAITYALYGSASGAARDNSSLRSKYAPYHIETCVKLTFSHKGGTYIAERKPAQLRAVKEGAKPVETTAKANLYILQDGTEKNIASNTREVNAAITALLGIDHKQFCQIAMIAQGDFAEILRASSNERQQIFRKLFDTRLYEKLQSTLSSRAGEINKKLESSEEIISQLLSSARCDENSPLYSEFSELQNDGRAYDKIIEKIREICEADNVLNNEYSSRIDDCNKEISSLNEALTIANSVITAKSDLENAEKQLSEQNTLLEHLKNALEDAKKNEPHIRILKDETANIRMVLPDYSIREKQRSLLKEAEEKLEKNNTLRKNLSEQLEKFSEKAEKTAKELSELKNAGEQRAVLTAEKEKAEFRHERIILLLSTLSEYEKLISEHEKTTEKYHRTKVTADEAVKNYNCKRNAYLDAQAGILAENLEDNMPCPVCGATHHPSPAKKPEGAPTQQELKEAEALLDDTRQNQERASREAADIAAKKNSVKEQSEKLMTELCISAENSSSKEAARLALYETENNIKNIEKKISVEDENIRKKAELEKQALVIAEKQESSREELSSLDKDIAAGEAHISGYNSEIATLSAKLEHDTLENAQKAISRKETEADALQKISDNAQKALADCSESISRLNGIISELKKTISDNSGIDIAKDYKALTEICENKRRMLLESKEKVTTRISVNTDIIFKAEKLLTDLNELIRKNNTYSKLSKTVCGNISGQEKLTLEAYVQAVYFERIIAHANKRLETMTGGQYSLKRKESANDLTTKCGLDLEIVDYFNGSRRDVGSLSGGESFKASLSLALGLADEIQSRTSGVILDSMFIDEGFGSLDSDSLDQAMSALNELGNTNRIIGIISHVDELKRRIEKKIIVRKISPSDGGESYGTDVTIEA